MCGICKDADPTHKNMSSVQVAQNKMLRLLDNSSLKDRNTAKEMLDKHGLLTLCEPVSCEHQTYRSMEGNNDQGLPHSVDPTQGRYKLRYMYCDLLF